jgi:hypothetical protein
VVKKLLILLFNSKIIFNFADNILNNVLLCGELFFVVEISFFIYFLAVVLGTDLGVVL